jgi:hypothetical protein
VVPGVGPRGRRAAVAGGACTRAGIVVADSAVAEVVSAAVVSAASVGQRAMPTQDEKADLEEFLCLA